VQSDNSEDWEDYPFPNGKVPKWHQEAMDFMDDQLTGTQDDYKAEKQKCDILEKSLSHLKQSHYDQVMKHITLNAEWNNTYLQICGGHDDCGTTQPRTWQV
jgi:hypothetical protein